MTSSDEVKDESQNSEEKESGSNEELQDYYDQINASLMVGMPDDDMDTILTGQMLLDDGLPWN